MDKAQTFHKKVRELRDDLKNEAVNANGKEAALYETAYEVMDGIERSFDHFLQKSEGAWQ